MLRCDDCGWIGHSEELRAVQESRGEFWGVPAYETMYYCPVCGSECLDDYEEVQEEDDEPYRFENVGYGEYLDSLDGKTPLVGKYHCVGKPSDEDGYEWRGFTDESWDKIKHMSDSEIYNTYSKCKLVWEE